MSTVHLARVSQAITAERERQEKLREDRKWGTLEDEDYFVLSTVLSEEVGETAKAILEANRVDPKMFHTRKKYLRDVYEEAVQTAAVAAQLAEKVLLELDSMNEEVILIPAVK